MITNSNMTIYNKVGNKWYQKHIFDVAWQDAKHANISQDGLETADSTKVFIPESSAAAYIKPVAFKSEEDKSVFFTLQKGDLVVKGICPFVFTETDREAKLREDYDDVMMITSIMDNLDGLIPHFELEVV